MRAPGKPAVCLWLYFPGAQAHTTALYALFYSTLFYAQTHPQDLVLSLLIYLPPHAFLNVPSWFPVEETSGFP